MLVGSTSAYSSLFKEINSDFLKSMTPLLQLIMSRLTL